MQRAECAFAQVSLIVVALGCGLVQASAREKHVQDVKAEQTPDMIAASALCRQLLQPGHHHDADTEPNVDPATLEADLSSLMLKSDEVVLVGRYGNPVDTYASVLSPSGKQAISYLDVRVLRTWKGSHKVGNLLNFRDALWRSFLRGEPYRPSCWSFHSDWRLEGLRGNKVRRAVRSVLTSFPRRREANHAGTQAYRWQRLTGTVRSHVAPESGLHRDLTQIQEGM